MASIEEIVLSKLGIQKISAFNILKNDSLCERIINEKPIWVDDFSIKYDIGKPLLKRLIAENMISSFSNVHKQGSKIFVFEEEVLSNFKLQYNTSEFFYNAKIFIDFYLTNIQDILTAREFEVIHNVLVNKMTFNELSEKYDLTPVKIRLIFDKALRRLKYKKHLEVSIRDLQSKYNTLKYEVDTLRLKRMELCKKLSFEELGRIDVVPNYDILDKKMIEFDLSIRALNCLRSADIECMYELVSFKKNDLMKFRNFGKKSLMELEEVVEEYNLSFGMDVTAFIKIKELREKYVNSN